MATRPPLLLSIFQSADTLAESIFAALPLPR